MAVGTISNISVSVSANTATVSFLRPSNVTSYVVAFTSQDFTQIVTKTFNVKANVGAKESFAVSGLTAGVNYYLNVTPKNGSTSGTQTHYVNGQTFDLIKMPKAAITQSQQQQGTSSNQGGSVSSGSSIGSSANGATVGPSSGAGSNTALTPGTTTPPPSDLSASTRQGLTVTGLEPNQTYQVQIYSVTTQADGTIVKSSNSTPITINTPNVAPSGGNFSTQNSNTDIQLSGGSLFAGTFPINSGAFDVVNGTTTGTGVILNQTGLAGFNAGAKEFWIDASTGKAYFAGLVTAGGVVIGKGVNPVNSPTTGTPAGTKNGIYINPTNYWYDDGTWAGNAYHIASSLKNNNPGNGVPSLKPSSIANLAAAWSGSDLSITFDFDPSVQSNQFVSAFNIILTPSGGRAYTVNNANINLSTTHQSYVFTGTANQHYFGFPQTSFSSISVQAIDAFGNAGDIATITGPAYNSGLPVPTITVSPITNGYTVSYTTPSQPNFNYISIEEYISASATEPTGVTYRQVYLDTVNPAVITTSDVQQRWVKARFTDKIGTYTAYSAASVVTPAPIQIVNTTPPTDLTAASAAWSGSDIIISYTKPAANAGVRFIVTLTAPNNATGTFYFFPDGTNNLNQTYKITKANLYAQFGAYYSSFTGTIVSASSVDNRSNGISFNVPARVNGLANITPVFTALAVSDGYTVSFNLPSSATYAEIYQKATDWGTSPANPPDNMTATYVSGGASGSKTLTVSSATDNDGNTNVPIPVGYFVLGPGIQDNTYVVSVSGNQVTLNNSLTQQASGTYTFYVLVYSGGSPANVYSNFYSPTYLLVRYYDDFGGYSLNSAQQIVTPLNPGNLSLIQNPVAFSTDGSILAGASPTTGPRVLINKTGIYAYDNNGNPTTTLYGDGTGSNNITLYTQKAQIADWLVGSSTIQNDLHISGNNYTGLSASGPYAFWAGADTSGNYDGNAKFSVTPAGVVNASNLNIYGGTINVGGGNFTVDSNGAMKATGADINGKITAQSGSFAGSVHIQSGGSLYAGLVANTTGSVNFGELGITALGSNGSTSILTNGTYTLSTTSANIGGWIVNSSQIADSSGQFVLDSSAKSLTISGTVSNTNYSAGIKNPTYAGDTVIYAGSNFTVDSTGLVTMVGATINGSNITMNNGGASGNAILFSDTSMQLKSAQILPYSYGGGSVSTGLSGSYFTGSPSQASGSSALYMGDNTSSYGGYLGVTTGSSGGGVNIVAKNGSSIQASLTLDANSGVVYIKSAAIDTNPHYDLSYNDISAVLMADSYGRISRGKAFYYSGSTSTQITGGNYSSVGRDGDIIFSVA